MNIEHAVSKRYSDGALNRQETLCCPVTYNHHHLAAIPQEIMERDYGCGDPSQYLKAGETVLDLGCGGGKICYIAAQIVGSSGRVIGIDMNDDMLALARKYQGIVAERLGFSNVEFRKARIQDLALDLEKLDRQLAVDKGSSRRSHLEINALAETIRQSSPLVTSGSIDVVVSNCVLNLVETSSKRALLQEVFRVLRPGGRSVISDIVSDKDIPTELKEDPELWSGCISGAFREDLFLQGFESAGFYGIRILRRDEQPWKTMRGIEFRSMTIEAFKGERVRPCEKTRAVVFKGPFKEVLDDDNHRFLRGVRYAVCDETFRLFQKEPYRDHFEFIGLRTPDSLSGANPVLRSEISPDADPKPGCC